jgi:hypothetical protein
MTDKTNAERQKRYREKKKTEGLRRLWTLPGGKAAAAKMKQNADIEALRKALDSAKREINSLQGNSDIQARRVQVETALKAAALLLETEAEARSRLILKNWKIREDQAAGILDRKNIVKLKKLKAFYGMGFLERSPQLRS